jgi:hypothetical protein
MNRNTRRKHKLLAQLREAREHIRILREGGPAAEILKAQYAMSESFQRSIMNRVWFGQLGPNEMSFGGLLSQIEPKKP